MPRFSTLLLALAVAGPAAMADPPEPPAARQPIDVTPHPPDDSPAALSKRLDDSLAAGNFENALYAYRSLVYVTGEEDPSRLARVADLALKEDLRFGDGWIRSGATEILARRGDADAVKALRGDAVDPQRATPFRLRAIQVLGEIEDKDAVEVLRPIPGDASRPAPERLAAADALLALGDLSGVPYLGSLIDGSRGAERLHAVEILADRRVGAPELLRKAAAAAGEDELRVAALRGLGLQGDKGAIADLRKMVGDDPAVDIPTTEAGLPSLPSSAEVPRGVEAETRQRYDLTRVRPRFLAARALLQLGDPMPVPFMANAIRDDRMPGDHGEMAALVASVDPKQGLVLLRQVLASKEMTSVASAARELVRLGKTDGVVDRLGAAYSQSLADDPTASGGRQRLVEVLADGDLKGAGPPLTTALADPEGAIRIIAAAGLARRGDPAGAADLRRVLDGGNRVEAMKAAEALSAPPAPPAGPARP